MGLFDKNLTNFADDVVLMKYDVEWSRQYKTNILIPKTRDGQGYSLSNWGEPAFVPGDVIWKDYMAEGGTLDLKYSFGFDVKPDKALFMKYLAESDNIKRLVFRNKTYFSRVILNPFFDKYNERLLEEYMKKRFKETHEDNEF
jgi:hypothetical protein